MNDNGLSFLKVDAIEAGLSLLALDAIDIGLTDGVNDVGLNAGIGALSCDSLPMLEMANSTDAISCPCSSLAAMMAVAAIRGVSPMFSGPIDLGDVSLWRLCKNGDHGGFLR